MTYKKPARHKQQKKLHQSEIDKSRAKWNWAGEKLYKNEIMRNKAIDWPAYGSLAERDKDYYRARAQQLLQIKDTASAMDAA